jgi:hypothetical protein
MEKALAKMKARTSTIATVCCVDTGEVATIDAWADRIAVARGVGKRAVVNRLYAAARNGGKLYGLKFEYREAGADNWCQQSLHCGMHDGHNGECNASLSNAR